MHYHIILTERCNLRCTYCYEKSMKEFDNGLEDKFNYDLETPFDSKVSVDKLKKFLKPTDTLIFYGGEPLIMISKIKEIMDAVDCRFIIQTNGIFLDKLPNKYLMNLDKMLISIDGTRSRDIENKGSFHYDKILKNIKKIRSEGYSGEIVARMAINKSDIYDQVQAVLELGLFDSVHWQIDAGFYKFDFDEEKFSKFVKEYNSSMDKLLDWWFENLHVKLYPFFGTLNRLKGWDEETRLPCGAGYSNFSINTKGDLSACPIMNSVKNLYCGNIEKGIEKEIKINDCSECDYVNICGGRCLYWKEARLWPKKGDELICDTIKHLIDGIKKRMEGLDLKKEDFEYEKYFGPEIIP